MNIHGMVNKSATNTADQLTNGIKDDFVTIKKAKNIPTENYIPKKSFAQADDNSVEVSSLFKESVILVFILGSMLIGLIVYDLNQNIVKTRGNNLEIVD
jgi:hypothetical protein|tara:strand:- start:925 stop:1221 length:297 start_codon:yes stop_codon:yes gene_type:complete